MKDVLLAQLRSRPSRLIATTIAVIVAVAFVVVTLSLGGAFTSTMRQAFAEILKNSDVQISCQESALQSAGDAGGEGDAGGVGDAGGEDGAAPRDLPTCEDVAAKVRDVDGVAALGVVNNSALEVRHAGERTHVQAFPLIDADVRWQTMDRGSWPEADNQIALDADSAELLKVDVGDSMEVAPIGQDQQGTQVAVVGVFSKSGFSFPQAVVPAVEQSWSGPTFDSVTRIIVKAAPGVGAATLIDRLQAAQLLPAGVSAADAPDALTFLTVDQAVEKELEQFTTGTGMLTGIATAFALIAVVVAGIVITLTFQVLVVQRTRELALLRCIGAEGGQVRRLVLGEAAIVGLVSSAIGALVGAGLVMWTFPMLQLTPEFADTYVPMLAGLAIGVVLTMICALGPARRATRVAPLAALRPMDVAPVRSRRGIVRLILGLLLTGAGAAAAVAGIVKESLIIAMPGGMALFVGLIMLYVYVVPPLLRVLSAGWAKRRAPSELAAANAQRNPGRTAATAAALVVGIGLVTTVITGRYSLENSLSQTLSERRPVDLIAQSTEFSDAQLRDIANLDGVAKAVGVEVARGYLGSGTILPVPPESEGVRGSEGQAGPEENPEQGAGAGGPGAEGGDAEGAGSETESSDEQVATPVAVFGMTPEAYDVARSRVARPETGELGVRSISAVDGASDGKGELRFLPAEVAADPRANPGEQAVGKQYTLIEGRGPDQASVWLDASELSSLTSEHDIAVTRGAIIIKLDDDVDTRQLNKIASAIRGSGENVQLDGGAFERIRYLSILDTMMYVVLGLLGAAVAISIIGVSNTLALSVLERTQESGLLRALGFTRGQMRAMLSVEALLIALAAAVGGLALGIFEGWLGIRALAAETGFDLGLSLPWGWLAGIFAVAVIASLIASVLPARTAAKTSPIQAMVAE